MSAVLIEPGVKPVINPKYKDLLQDPYFRESLKGLITNLIEEDIFFRTYVENILATSELKVLKRLAAVEKELGLNDYSDFEDEEEHEPSIPERLARVENVLTAKHESVKQGSVIIPQTVTEIRADFLVKHLPNAEINLSGEPVINSRGFRNFIQNIIPEEYRAKSGQNLRKIKRDVFEKASKLFPDKVSRCDSMHGNRELRLVLKSVT